MCWLGELTHIQLPLPLLERSLSKLINDANMDKFINWLAAWYKIYSDSLCALSLYSLFSPCKAQITFCCKLYFSLQTNSFMSFVYLQGTNLLRYSFVSKNIKAFTLLFQTEKWRKKERRIERKITIFIKRIPKIRSHMMRKPA